MRRYKSWVTMGLAITLAVTGCAQLGDTKSTQSTKSKQFAIQGCAVGGIGAAAATYLTNFGDKDAKIKASIAGVMGCMAGSVAGYQIGKRTETYADAQHAARSEIVRNEEITLELRQNNAQLAQNIDDYNEQISVIKDSTISEQDKLKNLKETKQIVTNQREKATELLRIAETDIVEARKQYDIFQAKATPQDKEKWQAEIADYEQEKVILSEHVSTLNALDASI